MVEALRGVVVVSFFDLTPLTGELLPEGLFDCVVDFESRVLTLLVDLVSLPSLFSSSIMVSTVTGLVLADFGLPAVLSVRGGLGGPLLMMRLRFANFSFEALISVEGGVKRL